MTTSTSISNPKLISKIWIWLSILTSVLVSTTSLFGIFVPNTYSRETSDWKMQAIGQDYANLIVIVLLLFTTYFAYKNSLKAYFIWLGLYVYLVYAFAVYAFTIHFQFLFLIYISVLGLSFYSLTINLATLNHVRLQPLLLHNRTSSNHPNTTLGFLNSSIK